MENSKWRSDTGAIRIEKNFRIQTKVCWAKRTEKVHVKNIEDSCPGYLKNQGEGKQTKKKVGEMLNTLSTNTQGWIYESGIMFFTACKVNVVHQRFRDPMKNTEISLKTI